MLYPWPDGGELAARAGLLSVGGCRGGLAPGALLVHQVAEPLAELLDGLALAGGGSLGGGRWAVRLPRMIAAIFCAVNRPKSLPTAPL